MNIVHFLLFAIALLINHPVYTAAKRSFTLPPTPTHLNQIPHYCSAIMEHTRWEKSGFIPISPTAKEDEYLDDLVCCYHHKTLPLPATFNYQIVHALNVLSSKALRIVYSLQYGCESTKGCLYFAQANRPLISHFQAAYTESIAALKKNWVRVHYGEGPDLLVFNGEFLLGEEFLVFKKKVLPEPIISSPEIEPTVAEHSLMRHLLTFFKFDNISCFYDTISNYIFLVIPKRGLEVFQNCFAFELLEPKKRDGVRFHLPPTEIAAARYPLDIDWITDIANRFVYYVYSYGEMPSDMFFGTNDEILVGRSARVYPYLSNARYKDPQRKILKIYRSALAAKCADLYVENFCEETADDILLSTCQQAIDIAINNICGNII